jgi:hypothetical protein
MKNIYIGDIHGRTSWKTIVEDHPDATNVVFVGDYFDSYDSYSTEQQIINLQEIINYKTSTKTKVTLLIGNHDHHYWPGVGYSGTSGYQSGGAVAIENFLSENKHHFQIATSIGNVLCTHAGVSPQFLEICKWDRKENVVDFLNDVFLYRPISFKFNGSDPYGYDTYQTPIWIRPSALQQVNKQDTIIKDQYIQIVGHTQQQSIDIEGKSTGGKYYYIDTLPYQQYLVEEDGKFKIDFLYF